LYLKKSVSASYSWKISENRLAYSKCDHVSLTFSTLSAILKKTIERENGGLSNGNVVTAAKRCVC